LHIIRGSCILLALLFLLVAAGDFADARGWRSRSRSRTPDPGCCIIYEGGSSSRPTSFGFRGRRSRARSSGNVADCIDNQTSCSGDLRSNLQCSSIPACPVSAPEPTPEPTPSPTEPPLQPIHIELTWMDNADNEDGFRVERMVDGSDFESIDILQPDTQFYDDMILPDSEYCYVVFAYNANGEAPTDVACITIPR